MSAASGEPNGLLFATTMDIRWGDLDAFNHVNNAKYQTYLEEARLRWLREIPGWLEAHAMPVMGRCELDYRRPITWPARIEIRLYVGRLGNSSFGIAHRILDPADPSRPYAEGSVLMFWVDPTTGKPVPIPAAIRTAAEARLAGGTVNSGT